MQEQLRLHRCRQALALVVNNDLKAAVVGAVAQRRAKAPVNKHQPGGVEGERQRITIGRLHAGGPGDKLAVEQPFQRGVFPVLVLTRRQAEAQHLLQVLLGLLRARPALGLKQTVPLLQRVTAVR